LLIQFTAHCGLDISAPDDWPAWLVDLMTQTAEDLGDLSEQFVAVARSMILTGELILTPLSSPQEVSGAIVFADDNTLSFTPAAFSQVCTRLFASRPVLLQALRQSNMLLGKPVNATTELTRISVWNGYGIRSTIRVYKLPRDAFEKLGEPLPFLEVDDL
jgi:hypothetical protein